MHTTAEQIFLIAPELRQKLANVYQTASVIISEVADNSIYTLRVNTVELSVTSGGSATAESISALLTSAINSNIPTIATAIDKNGSVTVHNVGELQPILLTPLTTNISISVTDSGLLGTLLLQQVLQDVAKACKFHRYRDEQEQAERYLAAHMLTTMLPSPHMSALSGTTLTTGIVKEEKVGDVTIKYDTSGGVPKQSSLSSTKYGKIFEDIKNRHNTWFI